MFSSKIEVRLMFNRVILIVDDNIRIREIEIPQYEEAIKERKIQNTELEKYDFEIIQKTSIEDAEKYLAERPILDVLLIDYNFNNSIGDRTGIDLIKLVRETVNKHCKIIFYTMDQIENVGCEALAELLNYHIYRFVDKADDPNMIEYILQAALEADPVVTSLEHFFETYKPLFNKFNFKVAGVDCTVDDILSHIRMDDEFGNIFVQKLLHKAMISFTEFQ